MTSAGARPPKHLADLEESRASNLGMLREQRERPGQRERGGLVPRQEERHDLVAELLVRHLRGVVVVPGDEEHREQIPTVLLAPPPLRNQLEDDPVEIRHGAAEADLARGPDAPREQAQREIRLAGEEPHQHREPLADLRRLAGHVRAEEHLRDDLEREPHDQRVQVDGLALGQAATRRRACSAITAVGCDALAVEGRLGDGAGAARSRPRSWPAPCRRGGAARRRVPPC